MSDSSSSLMPPPAGPSLQAPFPFPSPPLLTLEQLLKAPLAPRPPKGVSDDDNEPEPVPHTSSKNNMKYDPVDPGCLLMLTDTKVERFCNYVTALSGFVTFPENMKQPFTASTINNEGDVTAYMESQVVIPAWEAVTRMFPPSHRDYDILNRRQLMIEDDRLDIVFGSQVLGEGGRHVFTPHAVLKFKRPGIVESLLPVFVQKVYRTSRVRSEQSRGWVTVMQQLRKYAIQSACNHILVMDERVGIYLDFDDPLADHEDVHFLLAVPPDLITDENRLIAPHGLTLRELLVFMCYRVFGKVYQLRTIPVPGSAVSVPIDTGACSPSLPPDGGSQHRKHALHDNSEPRQQPKRNARSGTTRAQDVQTIFSDWIAGTSITLRLLTEDNPPYSPPSAPPRAVSKASSGFHKAASPRDQLGAGTRPFDPPEPAPGQSTITFTVSTVFARAAALLTTPSGTVYVGKLFSPLHTRNAQDLHTHEVAAYTAASSLQGREIPHFYGTWSVRGASHLGVVLTEFIKPGITIAHLQAAGEWARIDRLWGSAEASLKALHACGVRHGDLEARNIVLAQDGRVVLVDFDVARVEGSDGARNQWADWVFLRDVFGNDGEDAQGASC